MMYTVDDYKGMDLTTLTFDDAMNDDGFDKKPTDVVKYCGLDDSFMRSIPDFNDDELLAFMRAMSDFYNDNREPDYTTITSTAVKMALRSCIANHKERIKAAYVKAYQSFVRGKKRTQVLTK